MNNVKYIIIGIILILIIGSLLYFIFFLPIVPFVINWAEYPEYSETMPFYISTNETYNSLDGEMISTVRLTEENVEGIVWNYLINNFNFLDDADFREPYKKYTNKIKIENEVERKIFHNYEVTYVREINGLAVLPGDMIVVHINMNGLITIGWISFRNYREVGIAKIISPREAFEKLKNEEDIVNSPMSNLQIIVKEISLQYYFDRDENILIPAWHFKGDNCGYTIKGVSSYEFYSDKD
jgi:hypothetical protein